MQTRRDRPFDGSPVLSTTAVIPALDEERSIGAVLDAIPKHLVDEIIVVDGGSRDNTAAVAAAHGATIVREPRR
ncbi:MAG: glycosyltransferase, partial [Actinobacteria bacterium]|nr:glycosyltransferase [Actinomycetota bacterium]